MNYYPLDKAGITLARNIDVDGACIVLHKNRQQSKGGTMKKEICFIEHEAMDMTTDKPHCDGCEDPHITDKPHCDACEN